MRTRTAAPDAPPVDVYLNDALVAQNLDFATASTYVAVPSGEGRGIRVVAWYLPTFESPAADWRHLDAMMQFKVNGQHFDGIGRWRTTEKDKPIDAESDFTDDRGGAIKLQGARDVAEFAGGSEGLGYVTLIGQELFQLDRAFSAIVLLMVQGFVLHRLVVIARRRTVFWQDPDAGTAGR